MKDEDSMRAFLDDHPRDTEERLGCTREGTRRGVVTRVSVFRAPVSRKDPLAVWGWHPDRSDASHPVAVRRTGRRPHQSRPLMPMFVTLSALVSMLRLLERRWERTWAP